MTAIMRTMHLSVVSGIALFIIGCATTSTQNASPKGGPSADATPVKEPAFSAETRFAAGQLAESQNNSKDAISQYQEALKIDPNHLGSLYRLAVVYAQLKQWPKAIETWERYVTATGEAATAYADLGFCHELAGEPDKAEVAYQAGIAKDAKNVPCRVNYGLMLARKGQVNEATLQWQFVLSEAEIHYNLGSVYAQQGRKEQARIEYNKAVELDPKLIDAKTKLAALDLQ
jgi:tetratricopeptide (TPR) repeat protein